MGKINKEELFTLSAKELSIKYKVDVSSVYHLRKACLNPYVKTSNYVTNFLSNIDTSEKAYILGLLVADGTVHEYGIFLILHRKDKEILEKIHRLLHLSTPIIDRDYSNNGYKGSISTQLSIYSKVLCKNLIKYGLIQNKTHKTFFPNIDPCLYSHFIRGYFDGDGCIHIDKSNNLHIKIVGNITLIKEIQRILVSSCNITDTIIQNCKNSRTNIVNLQHGGNIKCIKILDYLYQDATIFMNRKYEIYKNFNKKLNYEI